MKRQEIYQSKQNLQRKYTEGSKYLFGKCKYRIHRKMDSPCEQNGKKKVPKLQPIRNQTDIAAK
jgi:hypothetical protein